MKYNNHKMEARCNTCKVATYGEAGRKLLIEKQYYWCVNCLFVFFNTYLRKSNLNFQLSKIPCENSPIPIIVYFLIKLLKIILLLIFILII